ncbi:hypothetical protein MNBD_NITROSPINAE04-655 [hydrothermal vent metagenome]|uniref:Uncharacterized protein n=1 Tax=hydrothermal vent metagenome TaxID=652676 RepID=A0A3B1BXW2_9ZZZZ
MTKDLRFCLKIIKVEKDKAEHGFIASFFSWKKLCDIGNIGPRRKGDPRRFNVVTIVKLVA